MLALSLPFFFFFFNDTATTEIYTLSLHDALPICQQGQRGQHHDHGVVDGWLGGMYLKLGEQPRADAHNDGEHQHLDRKSTRLNSSHLVISYAVFCLKKKKQQKNTSSSTDHRHDST